MGTARRGWRLIIGFVLIAALATACGRGEPEALTLARSLGDTSVAPRNPQRLPSPVPASPLPPPGKGATQEPPAEIPEPAPQPLNAPPAACSAPSGGEASFATREAFTARLVGAWQICSDPSIFATHEDGMEITADNHWYKLRRAADGTFVRVQGWENEGAWSVTDTSSMNGPGSWQLNFEIDGSGSVYTHPIFAMKVPRMHLDNNGVWAADYVTLNQTPDAPPPTGTQPPCTAPEGGKETFATENAFVEKLVGRWELCHHPSVFGSDEDGLEITSDHLWYKLQRAENGALVRMLGPNDHGSWSVTDTSSMNGPGSWQLNLEVANGSSVYTHPVFAADVPKMRLNNMGVYEADYIKLTV